MYNDESCSFLPAAVAVVLSSIVILNSHLFLSEKIKFFENVKKIRIMEFSFLVFEREVVLTCSCLRGVNMSLKCQFEIGGR